MQGNSIRKASSLLRIVGGFLGIHVFDYEKFYFNRLYMIAIWTLYACAIVQSQILFFGIGLFTTILGIFMLHSTWAILLVAVSFNASYKKTSDKCFQALCMVDDTLRSLGVSPEYRAIYQDSLITLILLFVVSGVCATFTSISIANFQNLQYVFSIQTMFTYPLFLTNLSDFSYWIVLRSIENRFERLNQYMGDLSADRENHGRTFSKNTCLILKSQRKDNSRNDLSKVWIIMKLHRQLNKTSREINRIFGVDFGLQLGIFFFSTIEHISSLYSVYIDLNASAMKKALLIISYITSHLVYFLKFVLINCACENVQRKSNAMEAVLTNFINTVHDFESCQEIRQFLMQVKCRPLQLTALGFISLGCKCLASMLTSIAETVIILIQLGGMSHANYLHTRCVYNILPAEQSSIYCSKCSSIGMSSILNAFYPLLIISSIFGAQMIEYRFAHLGYVQFVVSWSFYFLIVSHLWYSANLQILFVSVIFRVVMLSVLACSVITTILALYYKKGCFEDLTALNENLQYLGVPSENSKLQKSVQRMMMIWCIGWIIILSIDSMWIFHVFDRRSVILILMTLNYPSILNSITFLVMCEMLNYVGSRFDKMVKCMKILIAMNGERTGSGNSDQLLYSIYEECDLNLTDKNHSMWIVMRMHSQLCKTSRFINGVFGVQITLEIGVHFVNIVATFITLYEQQVISPTGEHNIFRIITCYVWCTTYVIRLVYINHVFDRVCRKANDTGQFIYNYLNSIRDVGVEREIVQFILYLLYRPLKFDSIGIQNYGYGFIIRFFAGVMTLIIIILQTRDFYQRLLLNTANRVL